MSMGCLNVEHNDVNCLVAGLQPEGWCEPCRSSLDAALPRHSVKPGQVRVRPDGSTVQIRRVFLQTEPTRRWAAVCYPYGHRWMIIRACTTVKNWRLAK